MPLPLLEREHELEAGRAIIEAAQEGRGAALLVDGPAGIGKSSVLSVLSELAEEAGLRWRCC